MLTMMISVTFIIAFSILLLLLSPFTGLVLRMSPAVHTENRGAADGEREGGREREREG